MSIAIGFNCHFFLPCLEAMDRKRKRERERERELRGSHQSCLLLNFFLRTPGPSFEGYKFTAYTRTCRLERIELEKRVQSKWEKKGEREREKKDGTHGSCQSVKWHTGFCVLTMEARFTFFFVLSLSLPFLLSGCSLHSLLNSLSLSLAVVLSQWVYVCVCVCITVHQSLVRGPQCNHLTVLSDDEKEEQRERIHWTHNPHTHTHTDTCSTIVFTGSLCFLFGNVIQLTSYGRTHTERERERERTTKCNTDRGEQRKNCNTHVYQFIKLESLEWNERQSIP